MDQSASTKRPSFKQLIKTLTSTDVSETSCLGVFGTRTCEYIVTIQCNV